MIHAADSISLIVFTLFSVIFFFSFIYWLKRMEVNQKWIWTYIIFTGLVSVLAALRVTANFFVPVVPLLMFSMVVIAVLFTKSESGRKVAYGTSLVWLVGIQSFRLPLELILHHWAKIGTIPEAMTWTGSNIDVFAGAISLLAVPFVKNSTKVAWIAQIVGFGLLLNVIRVVAMSSPFPFSWELERPLALIMNFPYALIGPVFVFASFTIHLLVFRRLFKK